MAGLTMGEPGATRSATQSRDDKRTFASQNMTLKRRTGSR